MEDFRDSDGGGPRRRDGGFNPTVEIEIERLRGKRDREYQRRKRAEAEMDEMEAELNEVKEKLKKMEEEMAEIASAPKPVRSAIVCCYIKTTMHSYFNMVRFVHRLSMLAILPTSPE